MIAGPAAAQTQPATASSTQAKPQDKLVIDADELVYDKDKNTVTAQGSVQLFYQGRVLQADKVIYERAAKRVYAEGHAKMTDEHGDVVYGSRFELSDDFRDGFIDSVQALTADKTRFSSPRVERSNGDITVMQNGAYTACEPCKDHPERPPFWQVRATKIIENQETHTIYYENAQLLFWGFPVFWWPYFSSPDATVNKQTGILAPSIVSGGNLGTGFSMPYFINLAPNYDLTLIPTYLSKQGLLGEVDWRQRLSNGIYNIRVTGIDQEQPGAFPAYPYGAGGFRERGSIESAGNFLLNDMWQFGWNGTWMSDKFFLNDYRLQGIDFNNFYFQDVISSVYLRGQSAQSFFDLSAYHFEGTTASDDNRTLPVAAAPVFDFNRVINVPADRTYGIGGELTIDTNVASIDQTNAAFQSTGTQTFDNAYHLYNVCETQVGSAFVNTYVPGKCMLQGIAGDYTRATGQLSWQRSYIDPIGEMWRPDHPACPHPAGHPHRGHHPDRGPDRARGPPHHSRATSSTPSSTISASTKARSICSIQQFRHRRPAGRRHLHQPEDGSRPTADYVRTMREKLPRLFPAVTFSFPPPDITSQILNFGTPAPLDVQVTGTNQDTDRGLRACASCARCAPFHGLVDARMQQSSTYAAAARRCRPQPHRPAGPDRAGRHQCAGDGAGRHLAPRRRTSCSIPRTACPTT